MHQSLLTHNTLPTRRCGHDIDVFCSLLSSFFSLLLLVGGFLFCSKKGYVPDVTSVGCTFQHEPLLQVANLTITHCAVLLPNVSLNVSLEVMSSAQVTCCYCMVKHPELLPTDVDQDSDVRNAFYLSLLFYIVMMIAVAVKLISLVRQTPPASVPRLHALLPIWLLTRESVESLILILASYYQLVLFDGGLYWEVWVIILVFFCSCLLAEAFTVGPVAPETVVMSSIPVVSSNIANVSYKIQALLCYRDGGLAGVILGSASIGCLVFSMWRSVTRYPTDLCRKYFAAPMEKGTVVLDLLAAENSRWASCKRKGLDMSEQMTRPIEMELLITSYLPHTIIGICLANLQGKVTTFMYLNIATGTSKIFIYFILRIWVLRRRSEWSEMNALLIQAFDVAARSSKCLLGKKAFLSRRLELQVLRRMAQSGFDPRVTKARSEDLYNLYGEIAGEQDWAYRKITLIYQGALIEVRNRECLEECCSLSVKSLPLWKASLGETHEDYLGIMSQYSSAIGELGRFEEKVELDSQLWLLQKATFGETHANTLRALNNYGFALGTLGRYEQSSKLHYLCWQLRKKTLGEAYPDTLTSMSNYSHALMNIGRNEESADLYYRCWQLRKAALGEEHKATLQSMNQYCLIADFAREEERAEIMYRCWQLRKAALGEASTQTLQSMFSYADMLFYQLGRKEESAELQYQCWQLRKAALGEASEDTLLSMSMYSKALAILGRRKESFELDCQCRQLRTRGRCL